MPILSKYSLSRYPLSLVQIPEALTVSFWSYLLGIISQAHEISSLCSISVWD